MANEPEEVPQPERRKHRRAEEVFIVTYRLWTPFEVDVKIGTKEYAAVAMDISEGGVGIDVGQQIPIGTQVRIKFKIVNEAAATEQNKRRAFELDGECRYCELMHLKGYRVGIVFKNMSPDESAYIAAFVKDQALKKYI
jgi:hypothetical protein